MRRLQIHHVKMERCHSLLGLLEQGCADAAALLGPCTSRAHLIMMSCCWGYNTPSHNQVIILIRVIRSSIFLILSIMTDLISMFFRPLETILYWEVAKNLPRNLICMFFI